MKSYRYSNSACSHTVRYLFAPVLEICSQEVASGVPKRIFELGCGNGSTADLLSKEGFDIVGVDPSEQGIAQARQNFPHLKLALGSSGNDLAAEYGRFPMVLSLEVIEHVFLPREYARRIYDLLEPGGLALISTPYHGYLKNLAMAITGKLDAHFTALWDYGHIKFWSVNTLDQLLREAGFHSIRFRRLGRVPPLAKAMLASARRPK